MKNKSKQKVRKRGNQGEGCRQPLRPFLVSHLFRLLPPSSTPSPAAHNFAPLCQRSWRGTGGHLVRFWAMSSPHLATTSQPIDQQTATTEQCLWLSAILPASPLPSPPSSGEGMAEQKNKQKGRKRENQCEGCR